MTLNADENIHDIEQARREHEEARKAKAKSINAIFIHAAESREQAREERRNYDLELMSEMPSNQVTMKEFWKNFWIIVGIGVSFALFALFTIAYFVERLKP